MAYPTHEEIDAAVPIDGEPNRSLTNSALKDIVSAASMTVADSTVPLRTFENDPFTGGRIKASPGMDPDDCVTMVQALTRTLAAPSLATSPGVMGEFFVDASYLYICLSSGSWVRFSVAGWPA